jgi:hypothetical protein
MLGMNSKMDGVSEEVSTQPALSSSPAKLSAGAKYAIAGAVIHFASRIGTIFLDRKAKKMLEMAGPSGFENASELLASYNHLQFIITILIFTTISSGGLMLWSVFRHRYRAKWLFGMMILSALKNFDFFPIGTALSMALLITMIIKRKEFRV